MKPLALLVMLLVLPGVARGQYLSDELEMRHTLTHLDELLDDGKNATARDQAKTLADRLLAWNHGEQAITFYVYDAKALIEMGKLKEASQALRSAAAVKAQAAPTSNAGWLRESAALAIARSEYDDAASFAATGIPASIRFRYSDELVEYCASIQALALLHLGKVEEARALVPSMLAATPKKAEKASMWVPRILYAACLVESNADHCRLGMEIAMAAKRETRDWSLGHLAQSELYLRTGDFAHSRESAMKGVEITARLFGKQHQDMVNALDLLARAELGEGKAADAQGHAREAVAIATSLFGEGAAGTLGPARTLAASMSHAAQTPAPDAARVQASHAAQVQTPQAAQTSTRHAAQAEPQPAGTADPREIPLPRIATAMGTLPGVNALPVRKDLPDVMVMNDGTRVTNARQWEARRREMKRILEYYAVGEMPPAPGNVKGTVVKSETLSDGVLYRLVHLTFGPNEKLSLNIGIFTPAQAGPFPAIVLQGGTPPLATALPRLPPGPTQGRGEDVLLIVGGGAQPAPTPPPVTPQSMATQRADVFRRGYALVVFNPNDCAEDTTLRNPDGAWAFRDTRFFPAYPSYDWGVLAGWAWGASRVADYLEKDPAIDKTKLIITGASRNGKSSMIAAAFDERLMGAPVVTGGGGIGAYRFAGPRKSETLDVMEKKYPNWFSPNLREFRGQREKLPFDEHWFLALAAPRPFIALEGDADTISLPEAVRQSILGAQPAYALFGAKERLGVNYAKHAHAFTAEDWTALMDFFDKNARGKKIDRTFDRIPTDAELDAAAAAATNHN